MKNTLKKITSLVLTAVLVFSLAACGCGYANSPEGVVKRVLNAQNNCDFVTQEKYHEDFEASMNELYNFQMKPDQTMAEWYVDMAKENVKDGKSFYQYLADEGMLYYDEDRMGEKAFKDYVNAKVEINKAYCKRFKVEINEVNEDGDEAWVKYTIKYPEETSTEDEIMEEVAEKLDLKYEYGYGKLDEKEWKKVIKEWKKLAIEEIKAADLEEEEGEYKVVKVDGTWKIAKDQSK